MASFSESSFQKKLADLNSSQQSIQTLSLWLIHHRKRSKHIVELWIKELKKSPPNRRLTFLYLANDVIQNSKKKGPEFHKAFHTVLPDAYKYAAREADEKTLGSMKRLTNIWKERGVYDEELSERLVKSMNKSQASTKSKSSKSKSKEENAKNGAPKKKKKVELSLREEIELEITNGPAREPPDGDELAKALQDLENSASSDASVREQIAALPPEVSDVSLLDKLKNKDQAERLVHTVDNASSLLTNYNDRLSTELEERREVARMLRDYITAQKEALVESEKKLVEYKSKLDQIAGIRKELSSHIQSLPDLTLLPDVTTGGLAPLPSAGDLFSMDAGKGYIL